MRRRILRIILPAAGVLAVFGPSSGQDWSDPSHVEFRLEHMRPEMRREVEALCCVLTNAEFDELLSQVSDDRRRSWIDEYWRYKDPIFTTPENEILIEHQRRVSRAEALFFMPRSPMWDERGEVYIRYGPPDFRRIIPADVDYVRWTPPAEVWYYAAHDMVVLFEDPFGRGEYSAYRSKGRGGGGSRLSRMSPVDGPLQHTPHPDDPPPVPNLAVEAEGRRYEKQVGNFYEVVRRTPAVYSYDLPQRRQPFVFSVDHFRGGERVDRVDVNIELQADLSFAGPFGGGKRYAATAVFWDTRGNETGRREQALDLTVGEGVDDLARLVPLQLVFSMPPGFYHMAVTVEDRTSGRVSSYRTDVTCRDFDSRLAVSDILLAAMIRPAERASPYTRGALEVVPHALRRYRRFESIPVYFEIYNLAADERGAAAYTVEYRVTASEKSGKAASAGGKPSRAEIASSFRMSVEGSMDVVHFEIKTDNLREGSYAFSVTVKDENSLATARHEQSFAVTE